MFLPIVVSDFPEVRQKQANKCLLLPCFDLFRLKFATMKAGKAGLRKHPEEGRRTQEGREQRKAPVLYGEPTKRDTPPIAGATSALYPHNFSHQKSRKKVRPKKT